MICPITGKDCDKLRCFQITTEIPFQPISTTLLILCERVGKADIFFKDKNNKLTKVE